VRTGRVYTLPVRIAKKQLNFMKFCLTISSDNPPNAPIIYKGSITEGIQKAAEFGFDAVEIHAHKLKEFDINQTKALLAGNRLHASAVSPGLVYGGDTFSFSNENEEIRNQALERIKLQIDISSLLGAQVLVGVVHGNLSSDPVRRKLEYSWIAKKYREIDDYAFLKGCKLAIEAINRYETNCFNRAEEIINLIKENGLRASGLLLDTFHMNIEETSIVATIKLTGKYLTYFHFPDSNRYYPGAGHLNLKEIMGSLRNIGYDGFVSLEVLPMPTPDIAAQKGLQKLKDLLK
jgi:5-keto-L-gluconate epimerase